MATCREMFTFTPCGVLVPSHNFPFAIISFHHLLDPPKNWKCRCCTLRQQGLLAWLTYCQNVRTRSMSNLLWELYRRQGVNLLGAFQTNLVFSRFQSPVNISKYILSLRWGLFSSPTVTGKGLPTKRKSHTAIPKRCWKKKKGSARLCLRRLARQGPRLTLGWGTWLQYVLHFQLGQLEYSRVNLSSQVHLWNSGLWMLDEY